MHHNQSLFLKPFEKLTEEQQQDRARIASHLPALEVAWKLKEDRRTWDAQSTAHTAEQELDAWIKRVRKNGPEDLSKALSAFSTWKAEILAQLYTVVNTSCQLAFPMDMSKGKTIGPGCSCDKDMALAMSRICVCAS